MRTADGSAEILAPILGRRARPDPSWLGAVAGADGAAVREVLGEARELVPLERQIRRSLDRTGRTYYAQFPAPLELFAIVRLIRPRHVVESGVSSGLSSAHLLAGLERNGAGTLHSIDLPQFQRSSARRRGELSWSIPPRRDSGWSIPPRLRRRWDLRQGPSEALLPPLLRELPAVDLFCHDSPWTASHLAFELAAIRPKLRSGSVVLADNTDHNPAAFGALARSLGAHPRRRGRSSLAGFRVP